MDEFTVASVWEELCKQNAASRTDGSPLIRKDHLFVYDTLDSSNTECKRRIGSAGALRDEHGALTKDGERLHKTVVVAAEQTAGRGRLGRAFYSPSQTGIYFSIIYVPEGGVTDPALYTVTAAVGVCRAIGRCYGKEEPPATEVPALIKWVNDVYVNGKKVCGILTEGVACASSPKVEAAIIGIGINIAVNRGMPVELSAKVGGILDAPSASAAAAAGQCAASTNSAPATRAQLLAAVITEVLHSLDSDEDVIPEYRSRSLLKGKKVTVTPLIGDNTTDYEATAIDVTDGAGLLVQLENGERRVLHSGEVTLHYTEK